MWTSGDMETLYPIERVALDVGIQRETRAKTV